MPVYGEDGLGDIQYMVRAILKTQDLSPINVDRSIYTFVVYCGSSIVVPSYGYMMLKYHILEETVSLMLAIYIVGCKWHPRLHENVNDVYGTFGRHRGTSGVFSCQRDRGIGRNAPYIISFMLFVVVSSTRSTSMRP